MESDLVAVRSTRFKLGGKNEAQPRLAFEILPESARYTSLLKT